MSHCFTYVQAPQLLPDEDQYVVVRDKITEYFSHSDTTDLIRAEVQCFVAPRAECSACLLILGRYWASVEPAKFVVFFGLSEAWSSVYGKH